MKRALCFLLCLGIVLPALVFAAGMHVQASMLVIGTITVNPDGSVKSYTVNDLDKLPPAARRIIQATVPRWEFKPVMIDGKAVAAKAGMSLRVVADIGNAQHATVRIAGAEFGCQARARSQLPGSCLTGTTVTPKQRTPPVYPMDAAKAGVGGEVFLVLEVGRDGRVQQAAARKVNLYRATDALAHWRKVLTDASLHAARKWRFHVPTMGANAMSDHWVVQVPVNYQMESDVMKSRSNGMCSFTGTCDLASNRNYGKWRAYIPGPVAVIPWLDEGRPVSADGSGDAIAGGGLFHADPRFVLLTPFTSVHGAGNRGG